jgi:hypothetical protein
MRATMLGMLRTPVNSIFLGLAAMAVFAVGSEPWAVAQRPTYPIVQEILVRQDCAILLAPADSNAKGKKAKFERDPAICHLETVLTSAHVEESIQDKELYRSRVTINEQEYILQNISDAPVVFVVEQNVPTGWQVDSDPQPGELIPASVGDSKLDKVAVFRVHADPGQAVRLHVGERHTKPLKPKVLKSAAIASSGTR